MFSGLLQAGTKALGGARFSLVNLMPTAFFITTAAILIASGAYTKPKPSVTSVFDKLGKSPGLAVGAAFIIFLVAVLLRPFQVALVQLLEGYWQRWPALGLANDIATERHRRQLHTADIMRDTREPSKSVDSEFNNVADYARKLRRARQIKEHASITYRRYPLPAGSDDRLMPTLLGNALRDGEDNAGRRYGLDMTIVYPRMWPSLSAKLDQAISSSLDILDTTAALCIAFMLIALLALPLVARLDWWSTVSLVAILMSILAYRGAITTARKHARLLATAFDLHRFDMLDALHYKLPPSPQEEWDLNSTLSTFLNSRNTVMLMKNFPYQHSTAVSSQDTQPAGSDVTAEDQPPDS